MRMMWNRRAKRTLAIAAGVVGFAATAFAQFGGFARGPFREYPNIPYDGRFTFVRVKYQTRPAATGTAAGPPGRTAIRSPSRT